MTNLGHSLFEREGVRSTLLQVIIQSTHIKNHENHDSSKMIIIDVENLGHSLLEREGVRSTLLQVTGVVNVYKIIKNMILKIIRGHPRSSKIISIAS